MIIGLGLTAWITALNYRGIRASATFQNSATFGLLALIMVVASLGLARGTPRNFAPLFSHGGLVLMKFLPFVPGHFTAYEYLALGLWVFIGLLLSRRGKPLAGAA